MMDMFGRVIRMQNEFLDIDRIEMKYAGFAMIDPDDGVIVMRSHELSPFLTQLYLDTLSAM